MLAAMIALALQSTPLLGDRAFLAAHEAWAACTNRLADAEAASARSAEEVANAALAACTAEQEATRRTVVANAGQARAPGMMTELLDGNREGLVDRVPETRRRTAASSSAPTVGPSFDDAVRMLFQCQKHHLDAALPGGGRDQDLIEAALGACPDEAAVTRTAALRMLGGDENAADRMMIEGRRIAREGMGNYVSAQRRASRPARSN
jgi:hypothetical protein